VDFEKYEGWTLVWHPLFSSQIEALEGKVAKSRNAARSKKILAMVKKLIREDIPANPASAKFRQGLTLGEENRHWKRAVFFQQYRLFFRYDSRMKVIIYVWMNDEDTLRAYDSKSDAYRVFQKMLDSGYPPGDFEELLKQSGFQN
jgi:toxin YhaV